MRIILSGGGSGRDTKELDEKFASFLDKSKPLLYIPIAIDNIKHPYAECLAWLRTTFDSLGVEKYEMWTESELGKVKDSVPKNFSGIYIGGGNTPYLLKKLRETGIWDFLKVAMKEDIPIYGGSAGAVIFSKSIKSSLYRDEDREGLRDYSGMDVLDGKEITCHYTDDEKEKVQEMIKEENLGEVVALSEKNGIYVMDSGAEVIGQEPVTIFDKEEIKEVEPGKTI